MVILSDGSAWLKPDAAEDGARPATPADTYDATPLDYNRDGQALANKLSDLMAEARYFVRQHRPAGDREALALCGVPDRDGRMAKVDPEENGIWTDVQAMLAVLWMCDSCIHGTLGPRGGLYDEKLAAAAAVLEAAADEADGLAESIVTAGTTDLAHPWRAWSLGAGPATVRDLAAAAWSLRTHAGELRQTVSSYESRSRNDQLAGRLDALALDRSTPLRHLAYVRSLAAEAVERATDAATWANEDEPRSRAVEHAVGRLLDCDETAAITCPLFCEYRQAVAGALAGWPEDRTNHRRVEGADEADE